MYNTLKHFVCMVLLLLVCNAASAESKPEWLRKGEASMNSKRSNSSYYFKIVTSVGRNLSDLRESQIKRLGEHIGQTNNIAGTATIDRTNEQKNMYEAKSSSTFKLTFRNDFSADVFYSKVVDEYWFMDDNGMYSYSTLYAVSEKDITPTFDQFSTTTSYGATAPLMSIVPGIGQFYKGQKLKGSCILGSEVLCVAGIILCENQRAVYANKVKEQPKFAKEYNTKANNWETGRNICIGVAAGIYVYNLIDAAVARGPRRVKVTKDSSLRISPVAYLEGGAGLNLTYNF